MGKQEAFITPSILEWAINRAGVSVESVHKKAAEWISGEARPTFKQAMDIAKKLQIPFGYLWLKEPPKEKEIIPDLRTIGNTPNPEHSLELKTLISNTKFKQEWFKEYVIENSIHIDRVVGKFSIDSSSDDIALDIIKKLEADTVIAKNRKKEDVLKHFIKKAEKLNILVMKNKSLGATKKSLNLSEFRGFAIYDDIAPLVFINSNDSKAAQIFTLIHELAHLWIGQSGISDLKQENATMVELKCNEVAAKVLMPEPEIRSMFKKSDIDGLSNMADFFSVSTLAILNRIRTLGLIPYDVYTTLYNEEINKFNEISIYPNKEKGFAPPQKLVRARNGDLFAFAVVDAVLNNKESYTNAVRLFDYKKFDIIEKVGKEFGILR